MQQSVYLVGLMGAGKTTVGRRLAKILGFEFIDTDQVLEQRTGVTVAHIFEIEGEQGFRERESKLMEQICTKAGVVISTGGGLVLRPENRALMARHGQVVYLKASLDTLWTRLKGCRHRPLLQTENPADKIAELLAQRDPIYTECADIIVEVTTDSAYKTAHKIAGKLQQKEQ